MRRGSAASARSRHTRKRPARCPSDGGLEDELRAGRSSSAHTDSSQPRSDWKESAWAMSAKPAGPPTASTAAASDGRDHRTAATNGRPPGTQRQPRAGRWRSGAELHPAGDRQRRRGRRHAPRERHRHERRRDHVVRAARRGDHHRREGEQRQRDRVPSPPSAAAPSMAPRAARTRSRRRARRRGCRSRRAPGATSAAGT